MNEAKKPLLDEGGKSIVAVMAALLVAIFAFQLNASMLSPALVAMQNELSTTAVEIGNTQTVFFTAAALLLVVPSASCRLEGPPQSAVRHALGHGHRMRDQCARAERRSAHDRPRSAGCCWPSSAVVPDHASPACDRRRTVCSLDGRSLTSVNGGIAGVDAILGWLASW